MPSVHRIARRLARRLPSHVDKADLVGAGLVGLADAIDKRRDDDDEQFRAYALHRIRGEMLEELRRMDPLTRGQRKLVRLVDRAERNAREIWGTLPPPAKLADDAGISESALLEARTIRIKESPRAIDALRSIIPGPRQDVEDTVDNARHLARLEHAIDALPTKMQRALSCFGTEITLREVGVELGVSEARVCQLRKEAVTRLRTSLSICQD